MKKRVALLGATGAVGSVLAGDICRSQLLNPGDELILVGHGDDTSDARLLAMRIDLLDAFDDCRIRIVFCPDPSQLEADIVIMAAGMTISTEHPTRRALAATNLPIFEKVAGTCVARLPQAVFIVVSNPVELAVDIFSRHTAPKRVLGMGAQQDSFRFARAVAETLGISRHEVTAGVLGEHGQAMLPLWSSVTLDPSAAGYDQQLASLRRNCQESDRSTRVRALQANVALLLERNAVAEAYHLTRGEAPDARIFVEPFITAHTLHSTPHATANATLHCLRAVLSQEGAPVYAQVRVEGQYGGIHGVCGLPVHLSAEGWVADTDNGLLPREFSQLLECSSAIQEAIAQATRHNVPRTSCESSDALPAD